MLEWEVLEEEDARLPAPVAAGRGRFGRAAWLRWLALLLALIALASAGVWWQARQQQQALRADLTEVLAVEAQLKALGEWEQGKPLLDPDAPLAWKNAYLYYLSLPKSLPGTPLLREVAVDEARMVATVTVGWPAPEGSTTREVAEQRAYRLVGGMWRRTPLYPDDEALEEVRSGHFVLRAEPAERLALQNAAWRFDPEGLRAHLAEQWPAAWLETRPITIVVQRAEFGTVIQQSASRRTLLLNSPRLSYLVTSEPLSSAAYYRLQMTDNLILKMVPVHRPEGMDEAGAARVALLQRQLQWAEARAWALDEGESAGAAQPVARHLAGHL